MIINERDKNINWDLLKIWHYKITKKYGSKSIVTVKVTKNDLMQMKWIKPTQFFSMYFFPMAFCYHFFKLLLWSFKITFLLIFCMSIQQAKFFCLYFGHILFYCLSDPIIILANWLSLHLSLYPEIDWWYRSKRLTYTLFQSQYL